jgi:uncharacterized protein
MATRKQGRAGDHPPARPPIDTFREKDSQVREESHMTPSYGLRTQPPLEGVTVIGEAVRRVSPECAEFLIEITTSATTAAQALRENHSRTTQVAETVGPLGVQRADIQSISLNVHNLYAPVMPALPVYSGIPQIGHGGFPAYGAATALQPDVQYGAFHARNTLRVIVRDAARAGDVADACAKAGAAIIGAFSFRGSDEGIARKAVLEAAGKDAQSKAESLAASTGKKVGEPTGISEDFVVSNGALAALRTVAPFAFGAGAPPAAGELEYYARVTATFRFQ